MVMSLLAGVALTAILWAIFVWLGWFQMGLAPWVAFFAMSFLNGMVFGPILANLALRRKE